MVRRKRNAKGAVMLDILAEMSIVQLRDKHVQSVGLLDIFAMPSTLPQN